MNFYISAKFNDKERVMQVYAQLKAAGHTITHEWIHNETSYPFQNNPQFTSDCASADINGVLAADVFVLLSHSEPSIGASAELGAAIASQLIFKKPHIYVVGPHFNMNFCFFHPVVSRTESVEEILNSMPQISKNLELG